MVTIHSQTKEITRSGQYWAFAHFSRNIRRGAKRIESLSGVKEVDHVAFENPNGQKVLVISNSAGSKTITVQQANRSADVSLPQSSVTTLTWS
jgi:glucosylceramidase